MFIFILFYFSEETRRKKINKRYEEVDGVRKEKERLTNDHRSLIFTFHLLSRFYFPGLLEYEKREIKNKTTEIEK